MWSLCAASEELCRLAVIKNAAHLHSEQYNIKRNVITQIYADFLNVSNKQNIHCASLIKTKQIILNVLACYGFFISKGMEKRPFYTEWLIDQR